MKQSCVVATILMAALCTPCGSSSIHESCPKGDCQRESIDDDMTMLQVKVERHSKGKMAANTTAYYNDDSIRMETQPHLCLNAASGDLKSGDEILLWGCSGADNEKWEFHSDYTIRVKSKPSMCMNAAGGDLNQGDRIILWACSGADNEKWEFHSDHSIRAKSKPSMCMNAAGGDINQGDRIILWGCSGADNEKFVYMKATTTTTTTTTINPLDGLWKFNVGPDEFEISGNTLTLTKGWNVGGTYSLSDVTGDSFSVSDGYGGESATYTTNTITFANGRVAKKE